MLIFYATRKENDINYICKSVVLQTHIIDKMYIKCLIFSIIKYKKIHITKNKY